MAEGKGKGRRGFLLKRDEDGNVEEVRWLRLIGLLVLLGILIWFSLASFRNIPAGYKGVIVSGPNGPSTQEVNEGWQVNPAFAVSDVEVIRYNTQTRDMINSTGSGLTVRSADNLNIEMDVTLIYHLPADKVADIRIRLGDYHDILDRYLRTTPRDISSNYTGEFLGGVGRAIVEERIRVQITKDLAAYDIIVDDFRVRSVDLPDAVDKAIEAKQAALQRVVTADYERQAVIIRAHGNASKVIIEAEAFRNATVIRANGSAQAVQTVMDQLRISDPNLKNITQAYLTMLFIEALRDPNSNVQFIIVGSDGLPVLLTVKP